MERFDAAVIGAGPNGLAAALALAKAGLKTIILERADHCGGRMVTVEFHPGFRASPWCDELGLFPPQLYWEIDAARHGAMMVPAAASVCHSDEGTTVLPAGDASATSVFPAVEREGVLRLRQEARAHAQTIAAHAMRPMRPRPLLDLWNGRRQPWAGEAWGTASLLDVIATRVSNSALQCHFAAAASLGRAVSPYLAGTALHLLGLERSGVPVSGLGALCEPMVMAAHAAGAAVRCSANVTALKVEKGRVTSAIIGEKEEIFARAFLSALDVKRTLLKLMAWDDLPGDLGRRAGRYRMHGAAARVLIALARTPTFGFASGNDDAGRGPIHIAQSLQALSRAHDSWRSGALAESLPVTLRLLCHPRLAPVGGAVLTATVTGVPARLVGSEWTDAHREQVLKIAVEAAERAAPGIGNLVLGTRLYLPTDIEDALGVSDGDLDGGEVAADQVLSYRPFHGWSEGRTPVRGLYLGGPSSAPSPFVAGAAGIRAAYALIADLKHGRLS